MDPNTFYEGNLILAKNFPRTLPKQGYVTGWTKKKYSDQGKLYWYSSEQA